MKLRKRWERWRRGGGQDRGGGRAESRQGGRGRGGGGEGGRGRMIKIITVIK